MQIIKTIFMSTAFRYKYLVVIEYWLRRDESVIRKMSESGS